MTKKLNIFLAGPRGFCAGVDRAIEMVKGALKKYGAPVYVCLLYTSDAADDL